MAGVKHYLYAALFFVLAFVGFRIYSKGREDERNEQTEDRLNAMRRAKEVRDEITSDPRFVDRARMWVKDDK